MAPIDVSGIIEELIIGIILLIIAGLLTCIWSFLTYNRGKKFEKQFIFVKSAQNITSDDFLFKDFNDYYLERRDKDSKPDGKSDKKITIEDRIIQKIRNKKDVTIRGKPDAGKTRCAFEVFRKLPKHCIILKPLNYQINMEEFNPPVRNWYFKTKHYIIFLDDVHQFSERIWIAEILARLRKTNPVSILSTLRTGDEAIKAQAGTLFKYDGFEHLLQLDTIIELRDLTDEEGEEIAKGTGKQLPDEFRNFRTPGIITGKWEDYEKRYAALEDEFKDDGINAKLAMKASRLLQIAGISDITHERLIAAVSAMEEPELTQNQIDKAENILKDQDIIGWDIKSRQILSGGKVLEKLVKDYPLNDNSILRHLKNLMEKLEINEDSSGLFEMGVTFHFSENLPLACSAYKKAADVKPDLHDAWYNWGSDLGTLAQNVYSKDEGEGRKLFEEAFTKYQKAVDIKEDKHDAWNNWGSHLGTLAQNVYSKDEGEGRKLFEEAFTKYQKAVDIKEDKHEAWNNWGSDLGTLAQNVYSKDEGEGRKLFEEAEEKVKQALKYFDSPQYRGLYGYILYALKKIDEGIEENAHAALLCAVGNDTRLLKYELSTAWSHLKDAASARPIVLKCGVALAVHIKLFKAEQWPDDLLPVLEENMSSLDDRSKLLLNWVKGNDIRGGQTALADENDAPIDVLLALLFSTIEQMEHGTSEA